MPRQKEFDVEAALKKAKVQFWSKGYDGTSMEDLLRCMGINRGSFYSTFVSKRKVYLDVLRRYDEEQREAVFEHLAQMDSPRDAILELFGAVCAEANGRAGSRGCFLANATLELAASDKAVASVVRHAYTESEAFFHGRIVAAQALGEIGSDVDPERTAGALLGLLLGVRVLARAGARPEVLRSIQAQVDALL